MKTFNIEIYKASIDVADLSGLTPDVLDNYLLMDDKAKEISDAVHSAKNITLSTFREDTPDRVVLMAFDVWKTEPQHVAHEAIHAADIILSSVGLQVDNSEPTALLIEYIVKKVMGLLKEIQYEDAAAHDEKVHDALKTFVKEPEEEAKVGYITGCKAFATENEGRVFNMDIFFAGEAKTIRVKVVGYSDDGHGIIVTNANEEDNSVFDGWFSLYSDDILLSDRYIGRTYQYAAIDKLIPVEPKEEAKEEEYSSPAKHFATQNAGNIFCWNCEDKYSFTKFLDVIVIGYNGDGYSVIVTNAKEEDYQELDGWRILDSTDTIVSEEYINRSYRYARINELNRVEQ